MKKYFYGAFFGLVLIAGLGFVIYWGLQPQPVQKIKPSQFETTTVVANSILLRLQQELQESPIVLWGLDGENADQRQVLRDFLNEPSFPFQVVVIDQGLEARTPEIQKWAGERIDTKIEIERLAQSLEIFRQSHARALVVMPTAYAAALLVGSPANVLRERGVPTLNLIFSTFPRNREQEPAMPIPCNVGGNDLTGTSLLGCQIIGAARTMYRKRYTSGARVGLMNQISRNDYLFLMTTEP